MYKTHLQVSKNFYLLSVPLLLESGIIPNAFEIARSGATTGEIITAGLTLITGLYAGYKGQEFGAGFPDLDLKGTAPDKKHPIIGKLIRGCGATHRGKFSHSLDSQTIFWGLILILGMYGLNILSTLEGMPLWLSETLCIGGYFNNLYKIWVICVYIGVLSHLFADLPTGGGVRLLSFMKPFKMKSKFFRTGEESTWETFYRNVSKCLTPICIIISIFIYIK